MKNNSSKIKEIILQIWALITLPLLSLTHFFHTCASLAILICKTLTRALSIALHSCATILTKIKSSIAHSISSITCAIRQFYFSLNKTLTSLLSTISSSIVSFTTSILEELTSFLSWAFTSLFSLTRFLLTLLLTIPAAIVIMIIKLFKVIFHLFKILFKSPTTVIFCSLLIPLLCYFNLNYTPAATEEPAATITYSILNNTITLDQMNTLSQSINRELLTFTYDEFNTQTGRLYPNLYYQSLSVTSNPIEIVLTTDVSLEDSSIASSLLLFYSNLKSSFVEAGLSNYEYQVSLEINEVRYWTVNEEGFIYSAFAEQENTWTGIYDSAF